jgi:hypothetical protein
MLKKDREPETVLTVVRSITDVTRLNRRQDPRTSRRVLILPRTHRVPRRVVIVRMLPSIAIRLESGSLQEPFGSAVIRVHAPAPKQIPSAIVVVFGALIRSTKIQTGTLRVHVRLELERWAQWCVERPRRRRRRRSPQQRRKRSIWLSPHPWRRPIVGASARCVPVIVPTATAYSLERSPLRYTQRHEPRRRPLRGVLRRVPRVVLSRPLFFRRALMLWMLLTKAAHALWLIPPQPIHVPLRSWRCMSTVLPVEVHAYSCKDEQM